jgi:hypothetical protein
LSWSYEYMLGIDPRIVKHDIRTYLDAKHFWQKLFLVNPHKEATIKDKVEKLIKVGSIYPMQLMEWVSNPVLVNKKQDMIHVCMGFSDLNKDYPNVLVVKYFILWMVFLGTSKFTSNHRINTRLHLYFLRVCSHIGKFLLALKMIEALFM